MLFLVAQLFLLSVSFVIGLLIAICIGVTKSDYDGSCLLYATFNNLNINEELKNSIISGSELTCNFCIFSGSISLLLALVLFVGASFIIVQRTRFPKLQRLVESTWESQEESPRLPNRTPFIGAWLQFYCSFGLTMLMFVTACLISTGFHSFCENGIKAASQHLESCVKLEPFLGTFYTNLSISQISCWLGTVNWMLLAILGRLRLKKLNLLKNESSKSHLILQDVDSEEVQSTSHV